MESKDLNRDLYTTVNSSIIHNSQKVDEWINKMCVYVCDQILFSLKKGHNFKDIMLNEINQSQITNTV
jgi:hypothetical protein